MMPNPRFLGEKYPLVGEGLVKEVLSSKEGCREIKEAEEAIKTYELIELAKRNPRINRLLKAVEKIREEELKYTHEKAELTRLLELREKQYIADRNRVLSSIRAKMHSCDYRD
jgi:CRISPR/Cas system-associated protein Cas5 (RAMP superfamily)